MAAMVYGDESWESTGVLSSRTILTGTSTCRGRKSKHAIFWDEPDLGLSDAWAAGAGRHIREFAGDFPRNTVAAFVVTHSKALVRELLPAKPTYLHLGKEPSEAPQSLAEWVEHQPEARDLEELGKESRERFKMIQHILNRLKEKEEKRGKRTRS